jgi:hypothetical protein
MIIAFIFGITNQLPSLMLASDLLTQNILSFYRKTWCRHFYFMKWYHPQPTLNKNLQTSNSIIVSL